MGLFSDIYNTVAKFFRPQEEQTDASKSVATNRLKLVLMQDRTNLTPKILEQMRSELIDLLSRYVEMDKELLELNFEQEGDQVALMLSIPVIRAKDEEEIEASLNAKKELAKDENDEDDEDDEDGELADEVQENSVSEHSEMTSENESQNNSQHVSLPEEMNSNKSPENENEKEEVSQD